MREIGESILYIIGGSIGFLLTTIFMAYVGFAIGATIGTVAGVVLGVNAAFVAKLFAWIFVGISTLAYAVVQSTK